MQLGLIGLGKMRGNMAERLRLGGHQVVGFERARQKPRPFKAETLTTRSCIFAVSKARILHTLLQLRCAGPAAQSPALPNPALPA